MQKVLIIDDSAVYRRAFSMALVEKGFSTVTAASGEEGIKMAQNEMPDLILLDMMMPRLDGMMFLRLLRGSPQTKAIPVIVMSGNTQDRDMASAKALGVVDYFSKSAVDAERLAHTVRKALLRLSSS